MLVYFIFSFFLAVIFSLILTFFFKRHAPGPFGGILYFFAIIFLFTVAFGLWMSSEGPKWLTGVSFALLLTLLIAELLPHKEKSKHVRVNAKSEDDEDEEILEKEFSILAYIVIAVLVIAIVYAIFKPPIKGPRPETIITTDTTQVTR